ncbi:MAG: hypothetical protein M0042_14185 [Nitrospiraceae bacterium]|nr:hypothetical protein [Nitrospiraceae bacterium]
MPTPPSANDLKKAYRTVSVIGLAMIASVFVYSIVVSFLEDGRIPAAAPQVDELTANTVKFVLLGIAAVLFFVIRIVNRQILSRSADQSAMSIKQGEQAGLSPAIQRLVTAAVVSFALCEAPAVFGLVIYILGRNTTDFYLFMLISLFFFSVYFPKYSQWETWLQSWQRQGRR